VGLPTPLVSDTEAGRGSVGSVLAGGEPNSGTSGTSVLGELSRTDWCQVLAEWLTGASMPACMAHGGATTRWPRCSRARYDGRSGAGAPASLGEAGACEKGEGKGVEQLTRTEPSSGKWQRIKAGQIGPLTSTIGATECTARMIG
jgi:hypothetical protein